MIQNAKIVGSGIQNDVYLRQEPGVGRGHSQFVMHRSELMNFFSCPSRWLAGYGFEETDATYFGSLFDCLVTAPLQFRDRYVETPKTVTATKTMTCVKEGDAEVGDLIPWQKCKEASEWKKMQKDKTIVGADDMDEAQQAAKRFLADPKIKELMDCSEKQVMIVGEYHDKETGVIVPTKCLIDLVPAKMSRYGMAIADIKTIRNAAIYEWLKTIDKQHYDAQAAINIDHFNAATEEARSEFLFPLLENVFPFEPARRFIEKPYIDLGRTKYVAALKLYCQCLKTGHFPGYDDASSYNGWTLAEPDQFHSVLKH